MDISQLGTILKQVDILFKDIEHHKEDAQNLLQNANRLATILVNVSELWVDARHAADLATAHYESEYDAFYIKTKKGGEKMSDETAKTLARIECREMYMQSLDAEHLSRKLYTLRKDLDRKVSVIQSYASELRSQYAGRKGGDVA